jgi:CO/xanthine dehydrogenase Mo-binding subunit
MSREQTSDELVIGRSRKRVEGRAKVMGVTAYTADLRFDRSAFARLVLSPFASARIVSYDLEAASRLPGVIGVFSASQLPRLNTSGPNQALACERVVYVGQPVVAVVAETEAVAADAVQLVDITYEPLVAITDPFAAMQPEAPLVMEEHAEPLVDDAGEHGADVVVAAASALPRNVTSIASVRHGNAAEALASAAFVVAGRYEVPSVHQGFMEPHSCTARSEPDGTLTIWTGTQSTFLTRTTVARLMGLADSQVRIVATPLGGGFGGKVCLLEPLVGLLARATGRTVHLQLNRNEEFLMGRACPGVVIDLQLASDAAGYLVAMIAKVVFDNGAGPGALGGLIGVFLGGSYRVPNLDITSYDVCTNKAPTAAYRAPGAPQAYFALELAMSELASKIGVDPIDLRVRNASREGDRRPDGTTWPRIGLAECLEVARNHPLRTSAVRANEGIGVAVGSVLGSPHPAAAGCRVEPDGEIVVSVGSVDITGTNTGLAMIAAEVLGVDPGRVRIQTGDSASAPYAGMAGGSKIIYTVGNAVAEAAADARYQLFEIASGYLEVAPEDLELSGQSIFVRGAPSRSVEIGQLARLASTAGRFAPIEGRGRVIVRDHAPMFTVHIAKVAVDRDTGDYAVTDYAAIQDVGKAINPAEIEGQIHGGALQGAARHLGEEMRYDQDGQLRTASFVDYAIPTIDQMPPIDVQLVEIPATGGPFGAKGVGEPPAVPGPAAIASALGAACGVWIKRLPVHPEDLRRALQEIAPA